MSFLLAGDRLLAGHGEGLKRLVIDDREEFESGETPGRPTRVGVDGR
jgi:hypothetical protein